MEDKLRIQKLTEVFYAIYYGRYGLQVIRQNQEFIGQVQPEDIIRITDKLVRNNLPMAALKTGISKFLNALYKPLASFDLPAPQADGLLNCCMINNAEMEVRLKSARPLIKKFNYAPDNQELRKELREIAGELEKMVNYYIIKENIIFPVLEQHWKDYRCLKVMWSIHDDIRKELQSLAAWLSEETTDITTFNRLAGDLSFHMNAIRFREERILFPVMLKTIPEEKLNTLLPQCVRIGFPYYNPEIPDMDGIQEEKANSNEVDLKTGVLSPEQIMLIFNHLPVDITFIDENDKVSYFSSPPDRIFPRSEAVIGRDVRNCHPPQSVKVVEKIVNAFRKGERDTATFWIKVKEETVLIQYFACRDAQGTYRGVIEVSQAITSMQSLTGERRLLDWKE